MSLQLKNPNGSFPPGGWGFVDPKTGFKCNGWEGTPSMHAVKIIQHRRSNPKFYPPTEPQAFDMPSIVQEIYAQKAKTHAHLFVGYPDVIPSMSHSAPKAMVSPTHVCPCGSTSWDPIYCKTCAGHRITGYKCHSCGKELKK